MNRIVLLSLIATLGTWFITALGAATVIFFRYPKRKTMDIMLGFAAGVMIAASFWSLLLPSIELSDTYSKIPSYITVTFGFLFGAFFVMISDRITSCVVKNQKEGINRIILLVTSITIHNIPEGMAVGVAFGALHGKELTPDNLLGAVTIAIGIGLQNFPEGAAVSLPLRREGYSRKKSFFIGQASGIVEPIAGIVGAALVVCIRYILPYALSFAAGAMIFVAVHELIPECQLNRENNKYSSTTGIISGFAIMTLLDVMLG